MLHKFIEARDDSKLAYRFDLSSGALFFAITGIIWWCSELLVKQRYKLSHLIDKGLFKPLYTVVFVLYILCAVCMFIHYIK